MIDEIKITDQKDRALYQIKIWKVFHSHTKVKVSIVGEQVGKRRERRELLLLLLLFYCANVAPYPLLNFGHIKDCITC